MSVELGDLKGDIVVAPLIAHAAAAWKRAPALLAATIDDYLLPAEARLAERDRAAIDAAITRAAGSVEASIVGHAVRLLRDRGERDLAGMLAAPGVPAGERLLGSTLARDAEFMREIIAHARTEILAASLPLVIQPEHPSLLARLSDDADHRVAAAARAALAVDRPGPFDDDPTHGTGLPAELHHRLTWWVAAIVRERVTGSSDPLDAAIAEAALQSLAEHDEGERAEATAMRLALLLRARGQGTAPLLLEAIGDRRIALFVAVTAHALARDYADVRDALLDPAGDRLWLMLRALDCPRDSLARIGLALGEADGRRDLGGFADALDTIVAIAPDDARAALAQHSKATA